MLRLKRSFYPLFFFLSLVLVKRIKLRSGASGTSILFTLTFIRSQTFYTWRASILCKLRIHIKKRILCFFAIGIKLNFETIFFSFVTLVDDNDIAFFFFFFNQTDQIYENHGLTLTCLFITHLSGKISIIYMYTKNSTYEMFHTTCLKNYTRNVHFKKFSIEIALIG